MWTGSLRSSSRESRTSELGGGGQKVLAQISAMWPQALGWLWNPWKAQLLHSKVGGNRSLGGGCGGDCWGKAGGRSERARVGQVLGPLWVASAVSQMRARRLSARTVGRATVLRGQCAPEPAAPAGGVRCTRVLCSAQPPKPRPSQLSQSLSPPRAA